MNKIFLMLLAAFPWALNAQTDDVKTDSLRTYIVPSITVSSTHSDTTIKGQIMTISESEIKRTYTTQDLPQMLSELPSILTYSENGNSIGYTNMSLRGFDQRRISVMVNGIPQNDPEDHNFYWINLSDFASTIDNIQVQRGAGLSSYGPAAIGGSIILSSVNYLKFKGINISSGIGFQEFGGDNTKIEQISSRYGIEVSSGLIDNKYGIYAKLGRINSFGYRDQSWAFLNSYFVSGIRIDGQLTSQLNIYGGSQEDGLAYNGVPASYIRDAKLRRSNYNYFSYDEDGKTINWTTKRRPQEIENFSQPQFELLNDWMINQNLTFKSALFYKTGQGFFDFDGTGWTDASSFRLTPENGFIDAADPQNPIIRAYVSNKYGGWIPRIEFNNEWGTLTAGAEIRIHRSEHWGKINYAENLPENFDPDYKFYSYNGSRNILSIFAGQSFKISDDLTINLDAQLVSHTYSIDNEKAGKVYTYYNSTNGMVGGGNELFNISYLFFNPRLGANYKVNSENTVYFSSAITSREPRMNNLYDASDSWTGNTPLFESVLANRTTIYDFSKPLVKPEMMINFELGWSWINANYRFNLNGYWMEYSDELVKSGQLDIFGNPVDGNAPKTRHYGIELMLAAILYSSDNFGKIELSANSTYSQNKLVEYNFATEDGIVQLNDNSIAGFPDIIANLRLSYIKDDLFASVFLRHVGEFRTDNFGDMLTSNPMIKKHLGSEYYYDNTNDAYTVVNADISYTFNDIFTMNKLKLHFQVVNLTNLLYSASGTGKEYFPAAERSYFLGFELGL